DEGLRIIATYATTGGKFNIDTVPPPAPVAKANVVKLGVVQINWELEETGCRYDVYRSMKPIAENDPGELIKEKVMAKVVVDDPAVDGTYYYAVRAYDMAGNASMLSNSASLFVDSIKPQLKITPKPIGNDFIIVRVESSKPIEKKQLTMVLNFPAAQGQGTGAVTSITLGDLPIYNETVNSNGTYTYEYSVYLPQQIYYYNGELNITVNAPDLSGNIVESNAGLAVATIPVGTGGVVRSTNKQVEFYIPPGVKPIIPPAPGMENVRVDTEVTYFITHEYGGELENTAQQQESQPQSPTIDLSRQAQGIVMIGYSYDINLNLGVKEPEIYANASFQSQITFNGTPILELQIDPNALANIFPDYNSAGSQQDNKPIFQKLKVFFWKDEEKNSSGEVTQPGKWVVLKDSYFDPDKQVMVAPAERVTTYAVFAEQNPPKVSVISPKEDESVKTLTPRLEALVEDYGVGIAPESIDLKIDGVTVKHTYTSTEPMKGTVSYVPSQVLVPGEHIISLYARDVVGNATTRKWKFNIDNTAPEIASVTPASGLIMNMNKPVISAILSDIGGGVDKDSVEVFLDDQKVDAHYDEGSGRVVYIPDKLSDGKHKVKLTGKDKVGEAVNLEWEFTVDTTPPAVTDLAPDKESFAKANLTLSAKVVDALSVIDEQRLALKIDGNEVKYKFDPASEVISLDQEYNWIDGEHEITIVSADTLSNESQTKWQFKVDTLPPEIVTLIENKPSLAINKPVVLFNIHDSLSGVNKDTIALTKDGALVTFVYEETSGEVFYAPDEALSKDQHKFKIEVYDIAGNKASLELINSIDNVPPLISQLLPAQGSFIKDNSTIISALIQDDGVGVDENSVVVKIDGKPLNYAFDNSSGQMAEVRPNYRTNCRRVQAANTQVFSEGLHTVEIYVKDVNGNLTVLSWSFTVDTIAPVIGDIKCRDNFVSGDYVSDRPKINTNLYDATSGIDPDAIMVKINGNPATGFSFDTNSGNLSYCPEAPLANGHYTLSVDAKDKASNIAITKTIEFVVMEDLKVENIINFPNPFKESTKFTYILSRDADEVKIEVFDLNGELLYETTDLGRLSGYNETYWDGTNKYGEKLANGVYLYRITVTGNGQTVKMIKKMAVVK
ncbi:MAG: Ig-like domain-containing protein, partial [bacterium]